MKKLLLLSAFLIFSSHSFSQIEIDEPEVKKLIPTPYNGDFMTLPTIVDDKVGLGLIGNKVTLIDVSTYSIKNNDGSRVSYTDEDKFKNKTFTIIDYSKDLYPILTIENESGIFKWEVSSTSKYVFNKAIDLIKEKLINKVYTPLHNESKIESIGGTEIIIDGKTNYKVTKVSFTKFSIIEYGIKVELNNEFSVKYLTGDYDQPTYHNGEKNVPSIGWINLSNNYKEVTFLETEKLKEFINENQKYISEIRDRAVKIGMTEQQCRWAWGQPTRGYGALVGYDEVYDWGGKSLYFKNDKLALIK